LDKKHPTMNGMVFNAEEIRLLASTGYDVYAAQSGNPCYYSTGAHPHQCSFCQQSSIMPCDFCMPCRGPYLGDEERHCTCGCGGCGEVEDEAVMQQELAAAQRVEEEARQVTVAREFESSYSGTNVSTLSRWPLRLRRQPWTRNGQQGSPPMSTASRTAVGARTAAQRKGACRSVSATRCGTATSRAKPTTEPTTRRHALNKAVGPGGRSSEQSF
jgi:hypothetical protein